MFDDIDVTKPEPSPATLDPAPHEFGGGEAAAPVKPPAPVMTSFYEKKAEVRKVIGVGCK